jgi:hypothetical protein
MAGETAGSVTVQRLEALRSGRDGEALCDGRLIVDVVLRLGHDVQDFRANVPGRGTGDDG